MILLCGRGSALTGPGIERFLFYAGVIFDFLHIY